MAGDKEVKFKKVLSSDMPLRDLDNFPDVVGSRDIWQIETLDAHKLGLDVAEQKELDEFLGQLYYFPQQKNADALLQHLGGIVQAPFGGYSQAVILNAFSYFIHDWFNSENPERHVFDTASIKNFFDNHEHYHYNLVKYSCYDHRDQKIVDAIKELFKKHDKNFKELTCFKKLVEELKADKQEITIVSEEPFLFLEMIQELRELFPGGERQLFTPFSAGITQYKVTSGRFKYVIIVGEDHEIPGITRVIDEFKLDGNIKIIRIKNPSPTLVQSLDLKIDACELNFLEKDCPLQSCLKTKNVCLTDLLLLLTSKLEGGLSDEERAVYEKQEIDPKEKIILPYDKLEEALRKQLKDDPAMEFSWYLDDNHFLHQKVEIILPSSLNFNSIQEPLNEKFELKGGKLFFTLCTIPFKYSYVYKGSSSIDFEKLETELDAFIVNQKQTDPLDSRYPKMWEGVLVNLPEGCKVSSLPNDKWNSTKDGKGVFYFSHGKPRFESKLHNIAWENFYSDNYVSIIQAEAACGKTWYLKDMVSVKKGDRIPIFITIGDMVKIKDLNNPIKELIENSILPKSLCRLIITDPSYFHFLLDGFDELPEEYLNNFDKIFENMIRKNYTITATVRNYGTERLQRYTSGIIIERALKKFDDGVGGGIERCFRKYLKQKIEVTDQAITLLRGYLQKQKVSDWLGIPFHVALLSEWYIDKRNSFDTFNPPAISELYNYILQKRIEKKTNRNRGDIYKVLYTIAAEQVFGTKLSLSFLKNKNHEFKKSLILDLERTGLLSNPYAIKRKLFHRTFAEFLVAKKLVRKIISHSCKSVEENLELVRHLYQFEAHMVCRFFLELFETHHEDVDMPFELLSTQQIDFKNTWLRDISGRGLLEGEITEKPIAWEDTAKKFNPLEKKQKILPENLDLAKEYTKYFKDTNFDRIDNLPKFYSLYNSFLQLIKDKEIKLSELELVFNYLSNFPSLPHRLTGHRERMVLHISGLYMKVNITKAEKELLFKLIFDFCDKINCDIINSYIKTGGDSILNWWKIEDLISLVIFCKNYKPNSYLKIRNTLLITFGTKENIENELMSSFDIEIIKNLRELQFFSDDSFAKNESLTYLWLCFAIYQNTHDFNIRQELRRLIREVNFKLFLRNDYPVGERSIYQSYQNLDEFDIKLVVEAFKQLKTISEQYKWGNGSYAFRCWSQGGFLDHDFSMPVLKSIGVHLNIIHTFYILLYIRHGGYVQQDKETFAQIAIEHIQSMVNEKDLKALFSSLLLFLSVIDFWKSTQEHPKLPKETAELLIQSFGTLITSRKVPYNAQLFIHVLFVNFMSCFNLRAYLTGAEKGKPTLTLISSNGFVRDIIIDSFVCQENYQKIFSELRKLTSRGIGQDMNRLDHSIEVWELLRGDPRYTSLVQLMDSSSDSGESDLDDSEITDAPVVGTPIMQAFSLGQKDQPSLSELAKPKNSKKRERSDETCGEETDNETDHPLKQAKTEELQPETSPGTSRKRNFAEVSQGDKKEGDENDKDKERPSKITRKQ